MTTMTTPNGTTININMDYLFAKPKRKKAQTAEDKRHQMMRLRAKDWVTQAPNPSELYDAEGEDTAEAIATPEEMREEAQERLDMLAHLGALMPEVARDFRRGGRNSLYHSESLGNIGVLYWTDQRELTCNGTPIQDIVDKYQDARDCVVYHSILMHAIDSYGDRFDMLYMLYVSKYKLDWQNDRQDLINARPYVAVPVTGFPGSYDLSPMGIQCAGGGLVPVLDRMPKPFC